MMGFALLSFWNIWDNGSDRELRCIGSLFSFLEGYPVGGFGNADNWACWVGPPLLLMIGWLCNMSEEVVAVQLIVRFVLGRCKSAGIKELGRN